jgi:hypothetical protein
MVTIGRIAVAALALAACGSFEDPAIVLDLRIIGMVAEPPEQLVAIDPSMPPDPSTIVLQPARVCAVVADPADARPLEWRMRVCPDGDDLRCELDRPYMDVGAGVLDDPDTSLVPQEPCAVVPPGPELLEILADAIEDDPLAAYGGVDIEVELRVVPVGGGEDVAVYGAKRLRFAPHLPAERTANQNPTIERFDASINGAAPVPLPLGRCPEQLAPLTINAGDELTLDPIEPPGAREDYVVPTFDGGSRMFTENLSYGWLATTGEYSSGSTGGERDAFGNVPPIDTDYRTPPPDEVTAPIDVPIWIAQRDERLGGAFYRSCVRVMPSASTR